MSIEFKAWEKIPRGKNEKFVITEKMDGTNACVIIQDDKLVGCQSKKRLITVNDDNYGFARWCEENKEDLEQLGDGYHFGEWVGLGIEKNPHKFDRKRFFLFNTGRWSNGSPSLPTCCDVVPVLFYGDATVKNIQKTMELLKTNSENNYISEGIICYYLFARRYEKYTFKYPDGKWLKPEQQS